MFHHTLFWAILIICLGLIAVGLNMWKSRYWVIWKIKSKTYMITRAIRTWSTIIGVGVTTAIVVGAIFYTDLEAIVIVTLFYATILFFTNFVQSERPFPVIAFDNGYVTRDYGDDDEYGLGYEFAIQNNGTTTRLNPSVEYKLFDEDLKPISTEANSTHESKWLSLEWTSHEDVTRSEFRLEPGEMESLEINYGPISADDGEIYIAIKITPRPQYRDVALFHTDKIDINDGQLVSKD